MYRSDSGTMFRGRAAPIREGSARNHRRSGEIWRVSTCDQSVGKSSLCFLFKVVSLEVAQGKRTQGPRRPQPSLTIVVAQVLLGIAEGKLDLKAGTVEADDAFQC